MLNRLSSFRYYQSPTFEMRLSMTRRISIDCLPGIFKAERTSGLFPFFQVNDAEIQGANSFMKDSLLQGERSESIPTSGGSFAMVLIVAC